jgi:hypothetical protein
MEMAEKAGKAHGGLTAMMVIDGVVSVFFAVYIIWLHTGELSWATSPINVLTYLAVMSLALRIGLMTALVLRRWWSMYCVPLRIPLWIISGVSVGIIRTEAGYFTPALITPIFVILVLWDMAALAIFLLAKSIREEFPARPSSTAQSRYESAAATGYANAPVPYTEHDSAQGNSYYGQSLPQQPGVPIVETTLSACPHCGVKNASYASHCSLCLAKLEAVPGVPAESHAGPASGLASGIPFAATPEAGENLAQAGLSPGAWASSPASDVGYAAGRTHVLATYPRPQARQPLSDTIMRSRAYLKSGKLGKWGTRCAIIALVLLLTATVLLPIAAQILYKGFELKADSASRSKIFDVRMKVLDIAWVLGNLSIPFALIGLILAPRNPETGRRRKKSLAFIVGLIFIVLISIMLILGLIVMSALSKYGW